MQGRPRGRYKVFGLAAWPRVHLQMFTMDPVCKLHVLGCDRNPFSVNYTQVGVLEEIHHVAFHRLMYSSYG